MNIIINRSDLVRHDPRAGDLEWFDGMVRMQGREDSILIEGHLGLLWLYCHPESRAFTAWAQNMGVLPAFNGVGMNLSGLDLRRAYLQGANLREADLEGADLYGANLRRAELGVAELGGADLYKADLQRAKLQGADLRCAILYGADLREADLYGADLREADLYGADLREADLRMANLYRADLRMANLRGAQRRAEDPPIPGWKVVNGQLVKGWDDRT